MSNAHTEKDLDAHSLDLKTVSDDPELLKQPTLPIQDGLHDRKALRRALSARQVQMIAIGESSASTLLVVRIFLRCIFFSAGTIGTGLFLGTWSSELFYAVPHLHPTFVGTGKSLATGGPGALLITYLIIGFIVYVTLILLGEMSTTYPTASAFNSYAIRFIDDGYGFALSWNCMCPHSRFILPLAEHDIVDWFNDAVSVRRSCNYSTAEKV